MENIQQFVFFVTSKWLFVTKQHQALFWRSLCAAKRNADEYVLLFLITVTWEVTQ